MKSSFFKRSAISLVVLGMGVAGTANAMHNNPAWSPQFTGVFIGVEGLNLRPMNGDLDYITVNPTTNGGPFHTYAISTDYDWNWRVYGGITFTDNDDITLSWMQMDTSDRDSVLVLNNANSTPRWLFNNDWDVVGAKVTFDLDQFYAVWGHTLYFNNPWSVRYAAGVEYDKVKSDLSVVAEDFNAQILGYTAESRLKGWGPRVEFNMSYHFPYGFEVFAHANAALLSANRKISLLAYDPDEDSGDDIVDSYFSTRHVIVPKLGMRVGVGYTMAFGQAGGEGGCNTFSIYAGWQAESYVHAIERPTNGFEDVEDFNATQLESDGFAGTKTSNFGDQGFFVGANVGLGWL